MIAGPPRTDEWMPQSISILKRVPSAFRMLIDCGIQSSVRGGPAIIDEIAADIEAATGGKIDVLVVTHEHWDHVSGFSTASEIFKNFSVGDVWMAWTENPAEPLAAQLDKYKGQALAALQSASRRLDAEPNPGLHLSGVRDGLQAILGFQFGAKGDKVRAARNAAAALAKGKTPVYLGPEAPRSRSPDCPTCASTCLARRATRSCCSSRKRPTRCTGWRRAAAGRWNAR